MVLDNLRYPCLNRFRQTCKHVRDSVSSERLTASFDALEDDFRSHPVRRFQDNPTDPNLMSLGYEERDIRRLRRCCPCHGCKSLGPWHDFMDETSMGLGDYYNMSGLLGRAWKRDKSCWSEAQISDLRYWLEIEDDPIDNAIQSMELCRYCVVASGSHVLWDRGVSPWLEFGDFLLVKCQYCANVHGYDNINGEYDGRVVYPNRPTPDQFLDGDCHDCHRGFAKAWVDPKEDFGQEVSRLLELDPYLIVNHHKWNLDLRYLKDGK
jgi:hypothetical protein